MNNELTMDWKQIAKRLKELREERGFSHEKLSEELTKKYGKKSDKFEKRITKQSLIDYEVNEEHHAKSGKVKGMSIENLYMLADFYNVSADYILGKTNKKSPDITMDEMCKKTGLREEAINSLMDIKCVDSMSESSLIDWINDFLTIDTIGGGIILDIRDKNTDKRYPTCLFILSQMSYFENVYNLWKSDESGSFVYTGKNKLAEQMNFSFYNAKVTQKENISHEFGDMVEKIIENRIKKKNNTSEMMEKND